jgi:hypothetical protein
LRFEYNNEKIRIFSSFLVEKMNLFVAEGWGDLLECVLKGIERVLRDCLLDLLSGLFGEFLKFSRL